MEEQVKAKLEEIAEQLASDGGGVELDSIDGNVVKVKLTGACGGCPMATMTLQRVVEAQLKEAFPEIERVEAV